MLWRRYKLYKSLVDQWSRSAKCTSRTFSTAAINEDESEHFKAAVLHPDKQSLAIETLANQIKLDDGMVNMSEG